MRSYIPSSRVEERALEKSQRLFRYSPTENIDVLEVPDFPSLGKLTALRFIEWLQRNPEGVISLPTGKTPEFFIKWTIHYLNNWQSKAIQQELAEWEIDPTQKPDMRSFHFVQIDEFFPMNPQQENSFFHYIQHFYINGFGLDINNAHLMNTWTIGAPAGKHLEDIFPSGHVDLSLRFRKPINELEHKQYDALIAADQWAMEYEETIKKLGGIGFFIGGIGPDGHVGFNIKGSDHFSTTRLIPINYETAASAATDLGGIELARQRVVITIGLHTITRNKTATAIIIAAGESKASIVKNSIENKSSILYPATALQQLPWARFYLTEGAASLLIERKLQKLKNRTHIPDNIANELLIDIAYKNKKQLTNLIDQDLRNDYLGSQLLNKNNNFDLTLTTKKLETTCKDRIATGTANISGATFLHTAPHHDDIMLGYLPYAVHLVRDPKNTHYFATMTSGFTSVANHYVLNILNHVLHFVSEFKHDHITSKNISDRNRDVYEYLDAVAAYDQRKQQYIFSRRIIRNLMELFNTTDLIRITNEIEQLKSYFLSSYPGKKDNQLVQTLKGMLREWEEELWWAHLGFDCNHTFHLRLGFYTGDIFTQQPSFDRDVKPILELIEKLNPSIITVAMDPEASGPDTHYKVLQAVAQSLKAYLDKNPNKKISVWGYRNVWFRFHPAHSNVFIPVSMNSLAILHSAFNICFGTQRDASFPSYEYDGPFSELAQKIMVEQYDVIKTCLGSDFFHLNPSPRLRAARGFCFLKAMTPEEFFEESAALKKHMEIQGL